MHIGIRRSEAADERLPLLLLSQQEVAKDFRRHLRLSRDAISLQNSERVVAHDVQSGVKRQQRLPLALHGLIFSCEHQIFVGGRDVISSRSFQNNLVFQIGAAAATKLRDRALEITEVAEKFGGT